MIQDIFPSKIDIAFKNIEAELSDFIIHFNQKR